MFSQHLGRALAIASAVLLSACKSFTPDGGTISVRGFRQGDAVRMEVVDTGVGIAAEDMPKLFKRFGQIGRGERRNTESTGLGLSIAKGLVEAHGGQIGVESVVGQGSTFWFTLPLHAPARS